MKCELTRETVILFLVLVAVAGIVNAYFIVGHNDLKGRIQNLLNPSGRVQEFPKIIQEKSFSSGDIAGYVENCYDAILKVPESQREDTVCYLLTSGSEIGLSASPLEIRQLLRIELQEKVYLPSNLSRDHLRIEYLNTGRQVFVS
ncbi:MAG: hypothetical protein JW727_01315 [Candidatus Aenigmarchaeota archaeon]|nr:hypothetical protein [Candidatus Aenigmarchaeota archaeon]